jgi:uncharacterized membrane protein (UPF0127 family)
MNNIIKISYVTVIFLGLIAASCQKQSPASSNVTNDMQTPYTNKLIVGKQILEVEVVDTNPKRNKGLSGREKLTEGQGMLFVFPQSGKHSFWMKDMNFNLDMIWVSNEKIVGISKNVPAPASPTEDRNLPSYFPPEPVDQVLEVISGWSEKNQIKIGDEVRLQN